MTAALVQGGKHLFGWGTDRHLRADLYDAMNVNTRSTGQWKKGKEPKFDAWPRPSTKPQAEGGKAKVTVASLYQKFTGLGRKRN